MAGAAEVPLDAAGEPGVAQGKVGRLEHRVAVEQFLAARLVDERVEAAAEARQDGGLEVVVLQNQRREVLLDEFRP